MTIAEQSQRIEAEFAAELARAERQAQAEQARAVAWVQSQVLPALDPRFDAAIVEAQQQVEAAKADLADARQALDAHGQQRPTDRTEVAQWARRRAELHAELEAFQGIADDAQAALVEAEDARRLEVLRIWSARGRQAEAELQQLRQTWQERIAQAEQALRDLKAQAETELGEHSQKLGWLRNYRPG